MNSEQSNNSIQETIANSLFSLLSAVPIRALRSIGCFFGGLFSLIPTRDKEIATLQLKLVLPELAVRDTLRSLYRHLGGNVMEMFAVTNLINQARIEVPEACQEYVKEIQASPRPVICLTGHIGNWDLMGAYFVQQGLPVVTIGRKARSPFLHRLLCNIRNSYGIQTIWRNSSSETRELINSFKKNAIIAALIDQDTRVKSIPVPFFGITASHPVSLLTLGKRFQADVVTTFIVQTGPQQYAVHFSKLPSEASEEELLQAYSQHLESLIRQYPNQWVWFHKRWRTRDAETVLGSSKYMEWLKEQINS